MQKYVKTLVTSTTDAGGHEKTMDGHCFVFLDPWGWKGMNRENINKMLQNPDCEIALLFSFNQFNRFMNFDKIDGLFDDLFSEDAMCEIRKFCATNPKYKKEKFVLTKFIDTICGDIPDCNCLPFKFKIAISLKTSHYMLFIVRNKRRFRALQKELKQFANFPDEDALCFAPKYTGGNAPLELFQ